MTPERWQLVKSLFARALDEPPEARDALLDAAGESRSVVTEVRRLLAGDAQAGSFLQDTVSPPSWAGPIFAPSDLVNKRYRIIGLLGRGGMGEVYHATDLALGQTVALKFLPEAAARDPGRLAKFHNEVRIARQVTHPNVCRVYDIGEVDGLPYLSMEYLDGEDLASLLRRTGRLPPDQAATIARKLCAGLAAAHAQGVLHRDLKPGNIMIDHRGQVVITDFGLAAMAADAKGADILSGTPAYMAPEQLSGREVSVKSDLYALGLVLYEVFSGRKAFQADTLAELIRLRESGPPACLSSVEPDIDPHAERVIARCLEPDPQKRPASALAVSAALPGGDPLAAAMAADETPAPDLVAAAGERTGMRPVLGLACLAATIAGLVAAAPIRQEDDHNRLLHLADRGSPHSFRTAPWSDDLEIDGLSVPGGRLHPH